MWCDMPDYLQVVRKGIQGEPREMRFGQCLWSGHGDNFRIGLRLIDKKTRKIWLPQLQRIT